MVIKVDTTTKAAITLNIKEFAIVLLMCVLVFSSKYSCEYRDEVCPPPEGKGWLLWLVPIMVMESPLPCRKEQRRFGAIVDRAGMPHLGGR